MKTTAMISAVLLSAVLALPAESPAVPDEAVERAKAFFVESLDDDQRLPTVLAGLRSTEDPALLPLFEALTRSGDRSLRLMGTVMIGRVGGKQSAPALLERLREDPAMVVRSEALVQLLALEAVTDEQLLEATQVEDEGVQVIAARALARRGMRKQVGYVLKKLADSRDPDTAALARMSLLGSGDRTQITPLRKVLLDEQTPPDLLIRLLNQLRQEAIHDALPVAEYLARPDQLLAVRVRAYMAIADLSTKASPQLAQAIRSEKNAMLKINLLRLLANRNDAGPFLRELSLGSEDDPVTLVSRLELARPTGGANARDAARAIVRSGHPILIEYVLNRFREDLDADRHDLDFYVQPILAFLRQTELDPSRMTTAHDRAALAVELLGELGSESARKGLWAILEGDDRTLRKLTAGALYRCGDPEIADLVLPLQDSPFGQEKTYAALLLGKIGNARAVPALVELQNRAATQSPDVLTLANWYLLKLAEQHVQAVKDLAHEVP
jgi:HEAT repeat protein